MKHDLVRQRWSGDGKSGDGGLDKKGKQDFLLDNPIRIQV